MSPISSSTGSAWRVRRWLVAAASAAPAGRHHRGLPDRLPRRPRPDQPTPGPPPPPGALVSGLGWILASLGFFFYVGNLANIGATYGAFATPIVLLLWLWLSGVVVLYGAAVNDQLAERRGEHVHPVQLPGADDPEIAGHPAGRLPAPEDDERGA